jgi:hemerythrin-like metal-binding protein
MAFEWTSGLLIGVSSIDEQHQELFRRCERLFHSLQQGDRSQVEPLFAYLASYAVSHFACEERWMAEAGYPGTAAHRQAHREFADRLHALIREYRLDGATPELAEELHDWLAGWLCSHIGEADRAMGRWLAGHGAAAPH